MNSELEYLANSPDVDAYDVLAFCLFHSFYIMVAPAGLALILCGFYQFITCAGCVW
jgi:hypothetical protein